MKWFRPVLLVCLSVVSGAAPASATQDSAKLRVGQWVQVKGQLDASNLFIADEIEVLQPTDKQTLIGAVDRVVDRETFVLMGQYVRVSEKTDWKDLGLAELEGSRVRVKGYFRGVRNFSAREISARGKGRDSIEGRIDRLDLDGPFVRLSIMGFSVQVGAQVDVEHAEPLESIPLAPESVVRSQGLQRDDDDEVAGRLRLGDTLTLGGQLEAETTRKDNVDLSDVKQADRRDYDLSVRLQAIWDPGDEFFALTSVRHTQSWRDDQQDGSSHTRDTRLSEAYGYWSDALGWGWDVQVGRQDFDDNREWLYDQNLDALRLIRSRPSYSLELSVATTLSNGNARDENSRELMAYLSNNSRRRHAAVYIIDRIDRDDSGEHFTHIGGRAYGEWLPQNQSWVEFAGLLGRTGGEDLGALGLDLGSTWQPDHDWAPAITAGWAWGSGDKEPASGNNGTFRQTGLQDNNDTWSGVTAFRYYGELVDPELANLSILTLGLGKRITRNNSIDLVWHRFDQVEPAATLINTSLRAKPDGVDTYLGWEADLIFGSRAIAYTQIEVVAGYFEPGDAFPGADPAWLGRIQLRYRF